MNDYNDFDIMNDDTRELIYVPVDDIHPHPGNPRKELGDLTELIDSIKVQGIFQNLTLVKGHYDDEGEFCSGAYTVIIGHRRLAAAKAAGLKEVPAVIVEMTPEEQMATMMTENMQRSDLTIYEQAKGFEQLKLFGWTEQDISDKTGFSKSTVKKRLKLAKLDEKGFKEAVGRGATLEQFAELDKVKDPAKRDELLAHIGTNDFKWKLQKAIEAEEAAVKITEWSVVLDEYAEKVDETPDTAEYWKTLYTWSDDKPPKKPSDLSKRKYYYKAQTTQILIYRDRLEKETDTEQAEQARITTDRYNELMGIDKSHYELREAFIKSADCSGASLNDMVGWLAKAISLAGYKSVTAIDAALKRAYSIDHIGALELHEVKKMSDFPKKTLLVMIGTVLHNTASGYWKRNWSGEKPFSYEENERLDYLYQILVTLGYQMSHEEQVMKCGEHPYIQEGTDEA